MANPKGNPEVPAFKANQFKAGQPSANPGGRPKKLPISDAYLALAEQELPEELRVSLRLKKGATYREAIALGQIRAAIKGKTEAAREVREAIEGKATQRLELIGADDPLTELLAEFRAQHEKNNPEPTPEPASGESNDTKPA